MSMELVKSSSRRGDDRSELELVSVNHAESEKRDAVSTTYIPTADIRYYYTSELSK